MGLPLLLSLFFYLNGNAQYKSFKLNEDGDTLNAIDQKDLKQGKWINHIDEVRGEPGYEEEGVYKDGKKEGIWRMYSLNGDLVGVENYKFGGKDGIQQYFTFLGDLEREESWRGYNPDAPYDTIPVYGAYNNEIVDYKIVKAEQYSVRQGEWKYYEPGSGRVVKVVVYDHNREVTPAEPAKPVVVESDKPKKVEKTPEMLQWEKKNKGKKKVLRDGATSL